MLKNYKEEIIQRNQSAKKVFIGVLLKVIKLFSNKKNVSEILGRVTRSFAVDGVKADHANETNKIRI
jgi:hypothetical protein